MVSHARSARPSSLLRALVVLAIVAAASPAVPASGELPDPDEIVRLYDAGRYVDARALLERLDEAGTADGVMLYRLAFCQLRAGEEATSDATMARALVALEEQAPQATEILVPFYLANTYQNLRRPIDVTRVANATVERVERGEIEIDGGVDEFRVAKLYADLDRRPEAADWYGRALRSFEGNEAANEAYVDWARRWLASQQSSPTARAPRPSAPDSEAGRADREAVEHAKAGRYAEAAEAWRRSGTLRPADPNRARYCGKLAATAATLETLPESAPDGRSWAELDKDALQSLLVEQAAIVRGARRLADALPLLAPRTENGTRWSKLSDEALRAALVGWGSGPDLPPQVEEGEATIKSKRRAALRTRVKAEIDRARPIFVSAGLWFGIGGHGLRETAFFGGFAPLIFRDREWSIARRPPGAARADRRDR